MNQKSLFDVDVLPAKPEAAQEDKRRWYISVTHKGKEWAVIATHSNGGVEWKEVGTFKHQPHLYKTWNGAKRQGIEYVKPGVEVTVKEWKGWQS